MDPCEAWVEAVKQNISDYSKMSLEAEEDSELRDLVAQTLQSCGILGKIKVGQS